LAMRAESQAAAARLVAEAERDAAVNQRRIQMVFEQQARTVLAEIKIQELMMAEFAKRARVMVANGMNCMVYQPSFPCLTTDKVLWGTRPSDRPYVWYMPMSSDSGVAAQESIVIFENRLRAAGFVFDPDCISWPNVTSQSLVDTGSTTTQSLDDTAPPVSST